MKKGVLLILSILAVILIKSVSLLGQEFYFKNHPVAEPLKEAKFDLVLESRSGYLWFGTSIGLIGYDGLKYEPFFASDTLTNNVVSAIYEDVNQRLWVGYKDGAIFYLDRTQRLRPWLPEEGWPKVPITSFGEDDKNGFWFSTYGEGVYFYRNQRMYNFDTDDGLLGNDCYMMAKCHIGEFWVATDGGISVCSIEEDKKVIENFTREDGLPDDIVRFLLPDTQGNVWIGTHDQGFCYYKSDEKDFSHHFPNWDYGLVNTLELFDNRELWIGTDGEGLLKYDLQTKQLSKISKPTFDNTKIFDLLKDGEGNLWVLSNQGEIQSTQRQFSFLSTDLGPTQAILTDRANVLWIGTQHGLYSYQSQGLIQQHLSPLIEHVISLYQDQFGNIWIGTFGEGVYCYNPQTKQVRQITERDGLTNSSILSIAGKDETLWLATLGGVTEINCEENILRNKTLKSRNFNREMGLGTNFIYKVFIDSRGRTWFGTDGKGISVLEEGEIKNYNRADSLEIKAVYSITEDKKGNIWFSTAKMGLFKFDGENFYRFTHKEGLQNHSILSLRTDEKGNIIIVHPLGMDILNPDSERFTYYAEAVGFSNFDPNLNTSCVDNLGNIWIGGQSQIVKYHPLEEDLILWPRVKLKSVSVFLEPVDFQIKNSYDYNQNSFVFDYVGLWYNNPNQVKYRYKIEGFDHDWITTGDRQIIYSNLPPGNYEFKLSSTFNELFEEKPQISYAFRINAPLWERDWVIFLAAFFTVGLVFLIIKQRERRLERVALLKKEKIESQFEALKSQINPHFLFNSFNTLVTIIEETPAVAVEYVEKLSDFYRSIIQYREKDLISLEEEIALVKNYTYLLKKRYGENLKLKFNLNGQNGYVAPLTLQMLVENAIKHNVISQSKPLEIEVNDRKANYICIQNNLQQKINQEKSTGFGLQNIATRYSLLSDKKIEIKESEESFSVSIPLIKTSR